MNQKLVHLKRLDNDKLYKVIFGALSETIKEHGPITKTYIFSAAKRIVGQIKTLIHNLEQEP